MLNTVNLLSRVKVFIRRMTEGSRESNEISNTKAQDVRPSVLYLEITARCNMSCPMCISVSKSAKEYRNSQGPEMSRRDVKEKLLIPCRDLGMTALVVSGGEPTLCDHLVGTLEDALDLDYNVYLATNLLLRNERLFSSILELLDDPRHSIQVSFDSVYSQEMNSIRGANVYDRVLANCRALSQLRQDLGSKTVLIGATILQSQNIDSVAETLEFIVSELKFDYAVTQPRSDYSRVTLQNFRKQAFPAYSEEMKSKLVAKVLELSNLTIKDPRIIMLDRSVENWNRFFLDPLSIKGPCGSTQYVFADAYGNLRGCLYSEVLNNLSKVSVAGHLDSQSYRDFMKLAQLCKICIHGCS